MREFQLWNYFQGISSFTIHSVCSVGMNILTFVKKNSFPHLNGNISARTFLNYQFHRNFLLLRTRIGSLRFLRNKNTNTECICFLCTDKRLSQYHSKLAASYLHSIFWMSIFEITNWCWWSNAVWQKIRRKKTRVKSIFAQCVFCSQ